MATPQPYSREWNTAGGRMWMGTYCFLECIRQAMLMAPQVHHLLSSEDITSCNPVNWTSCALLSRCVAYDCADAKRDCRTMCKVHVMCWHLYELLCLCLRAHVTVRFVRVL